MTTSITINEVTNATDGDDGTGVFDVLMQKVQLHITEQFNEGRFEGADYATVYLGALQATLQQAIQFTLQKAEAGARTDLVLAQISSEDEKRALYEAQTAKEYEAINASQARTQREETLNAKQVNKLQKEITDQDYVTTYLRPQELIKIQEDIDLLQSRDLEQLAATTRQDNESSQKIALMAAQTLGFTSDTKQKVLKQLFDGYSVNLSIAGTGTVPNAAKEPTIDDLVQEILTDIGSNVIVP